MSLQSIFDVTYDNNKLDENKLREWLWDLYIQKNKFLSYFHHTKVFPYHKNANVVHQQTNANIRYVISMIGIFYLIKLLRLKMTKV